MYVFESCYLPCMHSNGFRHCSNGFPTVLDCIHSDPLPWAPDKIQTERLLVKGYPDVSRKSLRSEGVLGIIEIRTPSGEKIQRVIVFIKI